jgi:ABC-type antimicrobial peptide transport system permease subunit
MAIRQALGASGRQLTRQLLIESALLAGAAGLLSVLVASWGLRESGTYASTSPPCSSPD